MTETRMNDRIAELRAALANGDITPDLISDGKAERPNRC